MFRIIKAVRPDYIIGENVPGLLSIEGGMVFEQVCLDLESEGYEVQAFVLPACATGAPHRRDRVWIVAYSNEVRRGSGLGSIPKENGEISEWNENAKFGNTDSGVIGHTTSNGHSGGCTETGGEKRESEQRGLLEFEGCGEFIESGVVAYSNISRDEKQSEEKGIKERVQREYREERCSGLPYGTIGNDGVTSDNYEKELEGGGESWKR
jgi:site-specific DNA-cytosine methylase